jgi:hypothetical protein
MHYVESAGMLQRLKEAGKRTRTSGAPGEVGGGGGKAPGLQPTKPQKPKFKKHRFCRYYDIRGFTFS